MFIKLNQSVIISPQSTSFICWFSDGGSEPEFGEEEEFSGIYSKGPISNPSSYSYLNLTDSSYSLPGGSSFDISPLSSPEKELGK